MPKMVPEKLGAISNGFVKNPEYNAPFIVTANVSRAMVAVLLQPVKHIPIKQNAVPACAMNVAILLTIPVLRILRVIHWSAKKLISNEKPHIPMGYKF